MRIKILVCLIIICVGTYVLTSSVAITAGVAILMYVMDRVVKAWADKKDQQYFYGGTADGEAAKDGEAADDSEDENKA